MKYVGLLISSVVVFLVILTNFYYNSITLDHAVRNFFTNSIISFVYAIK